jgi:rhamnose utilization protein RhaD (predicted bifunctional aldolase and dehydrogenase)
MHVVLDKCVIHLHAIAAQAYTSAKNGQSEALMLFKDEPFPPLWVPYANPGFELGHMVFRLVGSYVKKHGRKPAVLFMQKHGVLVASQSADGALELVHKVINLCLAGLDKSESASGLSAGEEQIETCTNNIAKALLEKTGQTTTVNFTIDPTIEQFLAANSPWQMLRAGPLTPDELAFVDSPILWLKNCKYQTAAEKVATSLIKNQQVPPKSFLVKDVGLFVAAEQPLASVIRDVVVASLFIRRNAHNMGGIDALSSGQRDFIENWEAEKFRVQLAADGG